MLRDGQDHRDVRLPLDPVAARDGGGETEVAWQQFHLRLRAFVSRRVRQRADAEDIVQKVFMEMHRSLPALRSRDRLGAWLHTTARNAVIDHYRAPATRREMPSGDTRELEVASPWPASNDDDDADRTCAAECLMPMIQRLPDAYRRAVERVELQGVTQRAAAAAEGISVSGMKSRVQRARAQLKAALLQCCTLALEARGGAPSCDRHASGNGSCGCKPAASSARSSS